MAELDGRRDIQTCREHHAHVEEIIARMPPLALEAASEFVSSLASLRAVLVRHLAFEDERLYPRLERSADPAIAQIARRYRTEMGDLAARFVAFFDRWLVPGEIERSFRPFVHEWSDVRAALERRILAEDNELYEMADRS